MSLADAIEALEWGAGRKDGCSVPMSPAMCAAVLDALDAQDTCVRCQCVLLPKRKAPPLCESCFQYYDESEEDLFCYTTNGCGHEHTAGRQSRCLVINCDCQEAVPAEMAAQEVG